VPETVTPTRKPPSRARACEGKLASGIFGYTAQKRAGVLPRKSLKPRLLAEFAATEVASGVRYYGHRYYSAELGRFINRDPIAEQGGLNLYGFCGNDGVDRWDYLGYSWLSKAFRKAAKWVKTNWTSVVSAVLSVVCPPLAFAFNTVIGYIYGGFKGMLMGIATSAIASYIGGKIPGMTQIPGGPALLGGKGLFGAMLRGSISGAIGGGVGAALSGRSIGQGILGGAIAGAVAGGITYEAGQAFGSKGAEWSKDSKALKPLRWAAGKIDAFNKGFAKAMDGVGSSVVEAWRRFTGANEPLPNGPDDAQTGRGKTGWIYEKGKRYLDVYDSRELDRGRIGMRIGDRISTSERPHISGFELDLLDLANPDFSKLSGKYDGVSFSLHGSETDPSGFSQPGVAQAMLDIAPKLQPFLADGSFVCLAPCYGRPTDAYISEMKSALKVNTILVSSGTESAFKCYQGPFLYQGGEWIEK
jgi:RHS repeat-associated protein